MNTLNQRLDNIHLRVSLPGTGISAELRHRDEVALHFAPGVYHDLSEVALERRLTNLARLLYVNWVRAYHEALTEEFRSSLRAGPSSQRDRDFLAARDDIVSVGRSADSAVAIACRGLRAVRVRVAPGARALLEYEFADRVRQAAAALIANHLTNIAELKRQFYADTA
jgi:hypothetical protein